MPDIYTVSSPAAGIDVSAGTDITILEFTAPADRRPEILGVEIQTSDTDGALAAQPFRIIISTGAGSGSTSSGMQSGKRDNSAPAHGLSTVESQRTGYTESSVVEDLLGLAPQGVKLVQMFGGDGIKCAVSTRYALIADSAIALTDVRGKLIIRI